MVSDYFEGIREIFIESALPNVLIQCSNIAKLQVCESSQGGEKFSGFPNTFLLLQSSKFYWFLLEKQGFFPCIEKKNDN